MLHPFSFHCSNHASTTSFPSPLLPNTTSLHFTTQSPTSPFPRRPFNPPALRSVLPVNAGASVPLSGLTGGKRYSQFLPPPHTHPCLCFTVNYLSINFPTDVEVGVFKLGPHFLQLMDHVYSFC